jgi:PAS domain S-box-containing protein
MNEELTAVSGDELIEQAPDALILADREGLIRRWNAAAAQVFGHSAEDAIGQSLDLIIPERFREQHWTGFHRALADGETKYRGQALPTRSERNGEAIYVELTFAMVHDSSGAVVGVLCGARDITTRFQDDRALRARLRELEPAQQAENDEAPSA